MGMNAYVTKSIFHCVLCMFVFFCMEYAQNCLVPEPKMYLISSNPVTKNSRQFVKSKPESVSRAEAELISHQIWYYYYYFIVLI